MFRNPQDLQNLKLSLKFNFEQDFMEKNGKTSATSEIAGTVFQLLTVNNACGFASEKKFENLSNKLCPSCDEMIKIPPCQDRVKRQGQFVEFLVTSFGLSS